jgi:hypothetical protein
MSRTPAAELARIKVRHNEWSIRAVETGHGEGYTAHRTCPDRRGRAIRIHALTVSELDAKLAEIEERRGSMAS